MLFENSVYLIYIDESGDLKRSIGNTNHFVISALVVPVKFWNDIFSKVKAYRTYLRNEFGIFMRKELHATDFIAGRGELGSRKVTKYERSIIFKNILKMITTLNSISIINTCIENNHSNVLELSYNRLLNRIQRDLEISQNQGILIIDEGKEIQITKIFRKMRVFNPIPSKFGTWENGQKTKNKTLLNLVADPFFKSSENSYFLQLVDFIAFACLRREEPTEKIKKYNLENAFEVLKPVLNLNASGTDDFGIVRN